MKTTPTGKTRYRHYSPLFRNTVLVLQIEVLVTGLMHSSGGRVDEFPDYKTWRDATISDLTVEGK